MRGTDCQQRTVNMNNYKGNYITAKLTYKANKNETSTNMTRTDYQQYVNYTTTELSPK